MVCTALYYINQNVTLTLWTTYFLFRVWYYWEIFLLYGFSPYLIIFPIWFVEQMTYSQDELKLPLQSRIIMTYYILLSWRWFVEQMTSSQDILMWTLQSRITMTFFKLFPLASENELTHISTASYELLNI